MSNKEYFKQYYKKNKETILGGQTARWRLAQKFLNEQKMKPCIDCGFTPRVPDQMDFDHVRGEKHEALSRMAARGCGIERIKSEIEKCELVCANCHRLRTYERRHEGVTQLV